MTVDLTEYYAANARWYGWTCPECDHDLAVRVRGDHGGPPDGLVDGLKACPVCDAVVSLG